MRIEVYYCYYYEIYLLRSRVRGTLSKARIRSKYMVSRRQLIINYIKRHPVSSICQTKNNKLMILPMSYNMLHRNRFNSNLMSIITGKYR